MAQDVDRHCRECQKCQCSKLCTPTRAPLHNLPIGRPWQMVAIDVLQVPVSTNNNKYLLVMQDYFTKWADAHKRSDSCHHLHRTDPDSSDIISSNSSELYSSQTNSPMAPISLTHYPLTTSLSDPPSPLQPGSSHPVLCSEVSSPGGSSPNLIRVHLPHAQRTVLHARAGVTLKNALKRAMQTRNLTASSCTICMPKENAKVFIDWNSDTTEHIGQELNVELKENVTPLATNHHTFVRNTFITLAFCDVCKKLLFQGFKCENCGFRYHHRCSTKVPIMCNYYDDDLHYA
ncbi:hypothetical protein EMCRGX_G012803 [Ephydatia muelleri]